MNKNIGETIRKIRIEKDLSQKQMAYDLAMSVSNYSKIERNETDLTISKADKIAQILNVSLSKILNIEDVNNLNSHINNGLQSINSSNPVFNYYNKEVVDLIVKTKDEEIIFLKNQISQKDELIKELTKKVK